MCPQYNPKTSELGLTIILHYSQALCFIQTELTGISSFHSYLLLFLARNPYLIGSSPLSLVSSPFPFWLHDLWALSSCPYVPDLSRWWCADRNTEHILNGVWGGGGDGTCTWSRMCNPTVIPTPLSSDLWLIQSSQNWKRGKGEGWDRTSCSSDCQIDQGVCMSLAFMHKCTHG